MALPMLITETAPAIPAIPPPPPATTLESTVFSAMASTETSFLALTVVSSHGSYECQVAKVGFADQAWIALIVAAELDGVDIEGGWCYRTYESQVAAWNRRQCYIPGNCDGDPYPPTAQPGTSRHGWGLAIDVWGATDVILGCSASELLWLQINAPRFGWVNPEWARCGQPGAEPWHWEYVGSELIPPAGPSGL